MAGGGDDSLDGGSGDDTMFGGNGNDVFIVDSLADATIENANQGTDLVQSSVDHTLSANVENLVLTGSAISATGNALDNEIVGNAQNNYLDGGAGGDKMFGGDGDDTYYVDSTSDLPVEKPNKGYDVVFSTVDEALSGDIEVLSLNIGSAVYGTGNAQNNTIFGNAQNNVLNGGGGADALSGLGGNDTFVFQPGQAHGDSVYEFDGGALAPATCCSSSATARSRKAPPSTSSPQRPGKSARPTD